MLIHKIDVAYQLYFNAATVAPCKEEALQSNFLYVGSVGLSKEELFSSRAHEITVRDLT